MNQINCQSQSEVDILIDAFNEHQEYLKKNGIKPSYVLITPEHYMWEIVLEYVKSQRIKRPRIDYRRKKKPLIRRLIKRNRFQRLR